MLSKKRRSELEGAVLREARNMASVYHVHFADVALSPLGERTLGSVLAAQALDMENRVLQIKAHAAVVAAVDKLVEAEYRKYRRKVYWQIVMARRAGPEVPVIAGPLGRFPEMQRGDDYIVADDRDGQVFIVPADRFEAAFELVDDFPGAWKKLADELTAFRNYVMGEARPDPSAIMDREGKLEEAVIAYTKAFEESRRTAATPAKVDGLKLIEERKKHLSEKLHQLAHVLDMRSAEDTSFAPRRNGQWQAELRDALSSFNDAVDAHFEPVNR